MDLDSQTPDLHVLEEAVEYAGGQLGAARAEEVREHLDWCADCAAFYAFVNSVEDDVVLQHARHLAPARLVALAESGEAPAAGEEAHLAACGDCREELRWARETPDLAILEEAIAAEALAAGEALTSEEPLTIGEPLTAGEPRTIGEPLTAGEPRTIGEPMTTGEPRCSGQLPGSGEAPGRRWEKPASPGRSDSARRTPSRSATAGEKPSRKPRPRILALPVWGWGVAGLAVAAALFLALSRRPESPAGYGLLVHLEALPTDQTTRGLDGSPDAREAYAQAMEAYAARDYRRAEGAFQRAAALSPDDAALELYLGSTLLLRNQAGDAVVPLRRAAELAKATRLAEESRFELAQAYLLLGQVGPARNALQEVVALDADRKAEAEGMLRKLDPSR